MTQMGQAEAKLAPVNRTARCLLPSRAENHPTQGGIMSIDPLSKSNAHFAQPKGADLFDRLDPYSEWYHSRVAGGYFPYARTLVSKPEPVADIGYLNGAPRRGINLAIQDYLGLTSHKKVKAAAISAINDFGIHSAGSAMLLGNNPYSLKLESDICDLTDMRHVLLFPTGWAAGYGALQGLIRSDDHIVIDALAHACLQSGANAATKNVHRFRHLDNEHAIEKLKKIRAVDQVNSIILVTEGIFSMDSDSPDLPDLQNICREFGAKLLVDVAHDLGALGPGGTGILGAQQFLGKADLVIGAFSKTFASNGGFIATNDGRVKDYLRWFANTHTFSNALSPVQCAIVSKSIEIVRSSEGDNLRNKLMVASKHFRDTLNALGCNVLGNPSAIVPVLIGKESEARRASKVLGNAGTFTNLVEFPAVPLRQARFRCQLMASHTREQLSEAASCISAALSANQTFEIA